MIRVTFADGATEDREDTSFVHHWDAERLRRSGVAFTSGEYACALESRRTLASCRGQRDAAVWRITSAPNEPLAGEWAECHVETCEEQIARLTTERDAAEERLADLRAWASGVVERGLAEAPKHPGNAEATWTIVSILETVVARIDGIDGESK